MESDAVVSYRIASGEMDLIATLDTVREYQKIIADLTRFLAMVLWNTGGSITFTDLDMLHVPIDWDNYELEQCRDIVGRTQTITLRHRLTAAAGG